MNKQKKIIIAVVAALVLLVAVLAIIHINSREQVPEGAISIHYGEKNYYVEFEKLDQVAVQGTLINGKGNEVPFDDKGIAVSDLLKAAKIDPAGINSLTVTAADEFSASLSAEEVNEEGKAYFVKGEDGLQLVVFGDKNMKRNVRNVEIIDIE